MTTIIVGGVVLLAAGMAARVIIRDKKNGKHTCGGNCASCRGCHH